MNNSSIKNIAWWTTWGLAMGGALFSFKESFRTSYYFLLAMPLFTGSAAAAISRLSHEYRQVATEVKRLMFLIPGVIAILAIVYFRAGAYGPFATGGSQRAFLGVTFGMSVPEVERAVERRLVPLDPPKEISAGMNEWLIDLVAPSRRMRGEYLLPELELFGIHAQARLDFLEGRLGHVQIEFDKVPRDAAQALAERLRAELSKEYPAEPGHPAQGMETTAVVVSTTLTAGQPTATVFHKGDVEARLLQTQADAFSDALAVELTYIPLVRGKPLHVDGRVF